MTTHRAGTVQWRQTTVLIRTDIFTRANELAIDISSECNRALADRVGIDYSQQKIPEDFAARPVIIASEPVESIAQPGTIRKRHHLRPVLNADDPATPARVLNMKTMPVPAPGIEPSVPEPVKGKTGQEETGAAPQEAGEHLPLLKKGKKKASGKKSRDDVIRQFLAKKILRTESGNGTANRVFKDELYQIFVRWCRSDRGGVIPDKRAFSIALKNRFVMEDGTADGKPCWINIKLR